MEIESLKECFKCHVKHPERSKGGLIDCPRCRNNLPRFTQIARKSRRENLEDAVKWVQSFGMDPILKLYVSDNGDWREAQDAGFTYIASEMFKPW